MFLFIANVHAKSEDDQLITFREIVNQWTLKFD